MPRQPRIDIPNTVYHVYTRGHNKSALFLDDLDRRTFLKYLHRACAQFPLEVCGYCLMGNHYHLQVRTLEIPLAKTMHLLNTLYAEYFNFRYGKVGHVFQNRYHSIPVEVDSYLLVLSRYIHLNPVLAGLVLRPEDYSWSSYGDYVGNRTTGLVQSALVLDTLSTNVAKQREAYRQFVESEIGKPPQFKEEIIQKTRIFGSVDYVRALNKPWVNNCF